MQTEISPRIQQLLDAAGRLPLSVVITTYNEEENIEDCLKSVIWADEILLVDSYSTDETLELAKRFPIQILQRKYYGSAAQKNWSLDRVKNDWVLIIDADERVPEELAAEILELLVAGPADHGYYIRRENVLIDRVIRHSGWSTDKVVRLFNRHHGRYPNRRVHADLQIDGSVPILKNPFRHHTFRSFGQYFGKFLNYAEWGAAQAFRDGRRAGLMEVGFRPAWRFFRMFVLQLGFLDGMYGLVLCMLQAFGVFLKYARLWEYGVRERAGQHIVLPAFDDDETTWNRPAASESGDIGNDQSS